LLQETSDVFGDPPAKHPKCPSVVKNAPRKSIKRKTPSVSHSPSDSDSDLDACFAKIAAVQVVVNEKEDIVEKKDTV